MNPTINETRVAALGAVAAHFDLQAYRMPDQAARYNAMASKARQHQLEILRTLPSHVQPVPEPLRTFVELCAVCGKPCEFSGWDVCVACQSQRNPNFMALKPSPNVSHRKHNVPYAVWAAAFCLFCTVMGLLWKWGVL